MIVADVQIQRVAFSLFPSTTTSWPLPAQKPTRAQANAEPGLIFLELYLEALSKRPIFCSNLNKMSVALTTSDVITRLGTDKMLESTIALAFLSLFVRIFICVFL